MVGTRCLRLRLEGTDWSPQTQTLPFHLTGRPAKLRLVRGVWVGYTGTNTTTTTSVAAGGEIVQETITSSVGDDTCTLEFQRSDGTLVTKLIDFKSDPKAWGSHRGTSSVLCGPGVCLGVTNLRLDHRAGGRALVADGALRQPGEATGKGQCVNGKHHKGPTGPDCLTQIVGLSVGPHFIVNLQPTPRQVAPEAVERANGRPCTQPVLRLPSTQSQGRRKEAIVRLEFFEVQVLKALVLGEEERGQSQYQVMCFVTKFQKGDFITADAMAKLRQKNPSTIRTPEEDRGKENYTMTGWVLLDRAAPISRHVAPLCAEAQESTYVRDTDLKAWAELPGSSGVFVLLEIATEPKGAD
ncbi:hypothetical protein AND_009469 [Anopheles darlingi]|uniref:Out at first protein BRICHOS-like domain-containing protein n=1 Tax=Anopheles darlingi TaxID=43151 RepID=W5J4Q3_ANODA|nr:hypothetical protein AND_009469 [Anopheles darlingi]